MRIGSAKAFLAVLLLSNTFLSAQTTEILLTVKNNEITVDEFEWLYKKNNTSTTRSSVEDYLQLYVNFRLKVEAAKEADIHNTSAFKKELKGYRNQLTKNYLTDQDVKQELLSKSYERSKTEINAYHVLIRCLLDASPKDSLSAYNKAMNVRQRLRLGEPFESVARGASDDPYVTINGGNLGYFTVFQTPMPFEDAAYSLNIGSLSRPVRTADGYHIIKMQDKREASGRIKVAHIMKSTPPGTGSVERQRAKSEIDSLYNLLLDGADFSLTVKNNSDDIQTAGSGGELPWFGTGEMIYEFSEAAFKLQRNDEYSQPVKTVYGWHIIKRIDRQAPLPYEEAVKSLESKMNQSYLISLSRKSFANKLKEEYAFKLDQYELEWFYGRADSSFRAGNFFTDLSQVPNKELYSFSTKSYTMLDFAKYINQTGIQVSTRDSISFINNLLDQKTYEDLIRYEDSRLEEKYPEFRYLINEFHDGILLFEISDSLIWKKAMNDTAGLREYYESRKDEFITKPALEARIFSIDRGLSKSRNKKLVKSIRKNHRKKDGLGMIYAEGVIGSDTLITITEGIWESGVNKVIDGVKWTKGFHQGTDNYNFVDILRVIDSEIPDFELVRGLLSSDYQTFLEREWLLQLREKYTVSINEVALQRLIQKYE